MAGIVPTPGPLIYVPNDKRYERVRRRGRFAIERERLQSGRMDRAITQAQEEMIAGLAQRGYRYIDEGFQLTGPLPHIQFSDDTGPDPEAGLPPDPRDMDGALKRETEVRRRIAKKREADGELVDFVLTGTFEHAVPTSYRVHIPESR